MLIYEKQNLKERGLDPTVYSSVSSLCPRKTQHETSITGYRGTHETVRFGPSSNSRGHTPHSRRANGSFQSEERQCVETRLTSSPKKTAPKWVQDVASPKKIPVYPGERLRRFAVTITIHFGRERGQLTSSQTGGESSDFLNRICVTYRARDATYEDELLAR